MYQLACSFNLSSGSTQTYISVNGLAENLPAAMDIVEDLVQNAVPDENILANLKADMLKSRALCAHRHIAGSLYNSMGGVQPSAPCAGLLAYVEQLVFKVEFFHVFRLLLFTVSALRRQS